MSGCGVNQGVHATNNITPRQHPIKNLIKIKKTQTQTKTNQENNELSVLMLSKAQGSWRSHHHRWFFFFFEDEYSFIKEINVIAKNKARRKNRGRARHKHQKSLWTKALAKRTGDLRSRVGTTLEIVNHLLCTKTTWPGQWFGPFGHLSSSS